MSKVSIVKNGKNIKEDIHNVLSYIGGLSHVIQKEDKVLLKPNLNDFDCITSPALMDALITYLYDHDIKHIVVAESTFGNKAITEKHFRHSGYYTLCEKYDIPLINLNSSEIITLPVIHPLVIDKIRVAKDVTEATKIINIPVMKVHYATGVTLGLKNLKGFLAPEEKKNFHRIGLDKGIVDLNNTIPIDLTIIDGIKCMETMGPKGGDVFHLGLLLAGTGRGETDYIACKIMGYDLEEVRHLFYYIRENKIDLNDIEVIGEQPDDVARKFNKVNADVIIPDNVILRNCHACSACMNALLLSFRFIKGEIKKKIIISLGSDNPHSREARLAGVVDKSENKEVVISFGNCSSLTGADGYVKGCPPYPLLLASVIEKNFPPDFL